MSDTGIEAGDDLSPGTSRLLEEFLHFSEGSPYSNTLKGIDVEELKVLIEENNLEDNEDFRAARDYILKLIERDNVHTDLPQVLYVMMTHIKYYETQGDVRLNFQNRDIAKTSATVCSLCRFALGEKERG